MENEVGKQESFEELVGVFIDPKTDFGFKRVFGNEEMMISFLNEVISGEKKDICITAITYLSTEQFGIVPEERRVIFDTYCKTDRGEEVVVEMQNAHPLNFANRLIFYSTYPVRNQAPERKRRGKNGEKTQPWYYDLKAIYIVAIINFSLSKDDAAKDVVIDWIRLMSLKTKQTFSDKLNFVIVDLTRFNRKKEELKTRQDFWLYTLKHAETLQERPEEINDEIFINLYDNILRTNKLNSEEMKAYNNSVLELKNLGLFVNYAKMEGMEIGEKRGMEIGKKRGMEIGKNEAYNKIVLNAADKGMSAEDISTLTDLPVEQVCNILKNKK